MSACAACGRENRSDARFCDGCGNGLERPRASEAERRPLTVMFVDLVGSTELSQRIDVEELRELLRAYQRTCAGIIEELDGRIAQYLGDGLLVYFGHPRAHEDDPVRAVRSALSIRDRLPGAGGANRLEVRIGIHTGPVLVGEIGAGERRESLALGDTVNLASRLMTLAEPGWIVISDATRRLLGGAFDLEGLGAKLLKGVAEPVVAHRVSGWNEARPAVSRVAAPLVGRDAELAMLRDCWRRATERTGQVVDVSGEAGIGKSRLVASLRETLAGEPFNWVEWRCSPYHESSALHPVLEQLARGRLSAPEASPDERIAEVLANELRRPGTGVPEAVPLSTALAMTRVGRDPALSPAARRRRTQDALCAWLVTLSESAPLVLVVEDLQGIDPSTLELLGMLIERASDAKMLILTTHRPDFAIGWAARPHVTQLSLGPLAPRQAEELVGHLAGARHLPESVVGQLVARTDGVPLFVEEVTRAALESAAPGDAPDVPSTLQGSLVARLDRLGAARELAQLASVVGREVSVDLLAAVAPLDQDALESALDELVRAEVLQPKGSSPNTDYVFRHALIQETAYESLVRTVRRDAHARIAAAVEERFADRSRAAPELAARHFEAAEQWEKAVLCYRRAGSRGTERSEHAEAVAHFRKALELLQKLPESPERDLEELRAQGALGVPLMALEGFTSGAVEAAYARALELSRGVEATPALFNSIMGLATFYLLRGELDVSAGLSERLLQIAEGTPHLEVLARQLAGVGLYYRGERHEALRLLDRASELYEVHPHVFPTSAYVSDPDVIARSTAAQSCWELGLPEQAARRGDEAVRRARRGSRPFDLAGALCLDSLLRHLLGDHDRALVEVDEAAALSNTQGFAFWSSMARALRHCLGNLEPGDLDLDPEGLAVGVPCSFSLIAEAKLESGDLDGASRLLALAERFVADHPVRLWDAELHRVRGELLLRGDDDRTSEAEARFRTALEIARSQRARSLELRAAASLARLQGALGRRAEGRATLADVYLRFSEGFGSRDLREARELLESLGSHAGAAS